MAFKKIDAPSIKELFLTQMEETILSGELRPGDKLPSERELADTMDISKTVVHEGIRELSRRGFLDVASRKGVYVADYTSTGNLDTLFAMFRYYEITGDENAGSEASHRPSGYPAGSGMSGPPEYL